MCGKERAEMKELTDAERVALWRDRFESHWLAGITFGFEETDKELCWSLWLKLRRESYEESKKK